MNSVFSIFKIKREERWPALTIVVYFLVMNVIELLHYATPLTKFYKHYGQMFGKYYHVSGFDSLTYVTLSDWNAYYNVYRHPLLHYFAYPLYLINKGLMWITDHNCAIFIVAFLLLIFALYSFIFLYRIIREVIGVDRITSTITSLFYFSFGYIILTLMVPDHFAPSMMLLLMTLYISGKKMRGKTLLTTWQTVVLFFLTAGISLNNGIKTIMSQLMVNGKRFFRPVNLLVVVVICPLLIWCTARYEYGLRVWPQEIVKKANKKKMALIKKKKAEKKAMEKAREDSVFLTQYVWAQSLGWSADLVRDSLARATGDTVRKEKKRKVISYSKLNKNTPISNGEFMRWTDVSIPRGESLLENVFGEGIQVHDSYLLLDALYAKPMIVKYNHWFNYFAEAIVVMLFLIGIWMGRRDKFFWLAMSFFALDMLLHVGLGFALNEVYIMSAHWMYIIPIAVAYIAKGIDRKYVNIFRWIVGIVMIYLFCWNTNFIAYYFL